MTEEQNQPREYDAVIGGKAPLPTNSAVLGGIEGVKTRLNYIVEKARLLIVNYSTKKPCKKTPIDQSNSTAKI